MMLNVTIELSNVSKKKKKLQDMTNIQLYVMLKLLSARLDIADIYQHLHFGVLSLSLSLSLSLFFIHFEKRRGIMLFQCILCTVHGTHKYFI